MERVTNSVFEIISYHVVDDIMVLSSDQKGQSVISNDDVHFDDISTNFNSFSGANQTVTSHNNPHTWISQMENYQETTKYMYVDRMQ